MAYVRVAGTSFRKGSYSNNGQALRSRLGPFSTVWRGAQRHVAPDKNGLRLYIFIHGIHQSSSERTTPPKDPSFRGGSFLRLVAAFLLPTNRELYEAPTHITPITFSLIKGVSQSDPRPPE